MKRSSGTAGRRGFTLIEALAALALVLAFAAALTPLLFQARRILFASQDRVAAEVLLRALLAAPLDRASLADGGRDGDSGGLRWRVVAVAMDADATAATDTTVALDIDDRRRAAAEWRAFRVIATVAWGPGQAVSGETVRLGRPQ